MAILIFRSTYTALMTILQRLSEDIVNKKYSLDMLNKCCEMREDLQSNDSFVQTLCAADDSNCFNEVLAKRCYERLQGGCAAIPQEDCADKQGKCPEKEPTADAEEAKPCLEKELRAADEKCDKCYQEIRAEIEAEKEADDAAQKQESEIAVKKKKCCP